MRILFRKCAQYPLLDPQKELLGEQARTVDSCGQALAHLFLEVGRQVETRDAFDLNKEGMLCLALGRLDNQL